MRIDERLLSRLCVALSIAGMAAIFIITSVQQPEKAAISSLDANDVGKLAQIEGVISNIELTSEGHLFFSLVGDGEIRVVLFKPDLAALGLSPEVFIEGRSAVVTGLVKQYRGELEIMPKEVTLG